MRNRTIVLFWAATLASALFLGSFWDLKERWGASVLSDVFVLLAMVGVGITFLIGARIVFVVGRAKRQRPTRVS